MDERERARIYLFLVRFDGDDRVIPDRNPSNLLQFNEENSARSSADENSKFGQTSARFAGKRVHFTVDTASESFQASEYKSIHHSWRSYGKPRSYSLRSPNDRYAFVC